MRSISITSRFKRDYKVLNRSDPGLEKLFTPVVEWLVKGEKLPERYKDHALSGDLKGFRDCHIKPDLVLIYSLSDTEVTLVRLGSHSDLFG